MKKVKSVFRDEIHYLYYLNNVLVTTHCEYQGIVDYCAEHNLELVKSTGL